MKPQIKHIIEFQGTSNIAFGHWLFFCLLISALSFSSCKKFLEIPPPKNGLVTASVFDNNSSATSAQIAIYGQMCINAESYRMSAHVGMYADELRNYCSSSYLVQLYTNLLVANGSTQPYANWSGYYSYIYQANAVISGLQTTAGCSAAVKQQLTGEAYFIRAFWYFYLTNIYGDVPLVLTTSYITNSTIPRSSRVLVLHQVIADLTTAENMLNSNYVDGTDTVITTERVRPTKVGAQALLARAYLYLADYDGATASFAKAEAEADTVISNSAYSLSPLNEVFLKNSSEAIWQLQTLPNQPSDTPDAADFILLGAPSTTSVNNCTTISTELIDSFEPNDQRLVAWIGSITEGTTTYYFPYKYKNYTYAGTEYDMVLRLGEQFLIRAEARAEQGNLPGAMADLNMIRSRAALPNYSGTKTQAAVLTAILHERQVELFTEWGHRWFDLCRTGNAPIVMGGPNGVCQAKGGTWNPDNYQLLFPIPQADRSADPNLTQNIGY